MTYSLSYNCGAQGYDRKGHWGDDCPDLDYYDIDSLGRQIKTWSAENANQFIDSEVEDSESEDEKKQNLSPSNDSPSDDNPSNDSQYDPMGDLEDFANDRPSKKRSENRAMESEDEGEVKESTSPPTRSTWYD